MNTYTVRLERLRDSLRRKRLEAFCLINVESSDRSNLYYLTGFSGSFGVLIVTKDRQIFLTDSRYITRAKEIVSGYHRHQRPPDLSDGLSLHHPRQGDRLRL